jgi:hypothetical protein
MVKIVEVFAANGFEHRVQLRFRSTMRAQRNPYRRLNADRTFRTKTGRKAETIDASLSGP